MKRSQFLRNAMMAIAVSLVPKILQPVVPEVEENIYKITTHYPLEWKNWGYEQDGFVMWVGEDTLKLWNDWWKEYHQRSLGIPF